MEAGGNTTPGRRDKQQVSGDDGSVVKEAAEALKKIAKDPLWGLPLGGVKRPWMRYGIEVKTRNLVQDVGVILWEGGAKTTVDLKREILELLDQTDSLVVLTDLKRAEHPEDASWWPSLRTVLAWVEEDPFFAKAIDQWRHARQETILEQTIHDLYSGAPMSKDELAILKERVKFAAGVLPRTVNKGMRDKVDVEQTHNHMHIHANLSEEALEEKLAHLSRDARVREFVASQGLGNAVDCEVVAPPPPHPEMPALPFRDPEAMGLELGGDEVAP